MSDSTVFPFQPKCMSPAQLAAVSYLARYEGRMHELYTYRLRRWCIRCENNGLDSELYYREAVEMIDDRTQLS